MGKSDNRQDLKNYLGNYSDILINFCQMYIKSYGRDV